MSEIIYVNFKPETSDKPLWEKIFDGLVEGKTGASFQDLMLQAFGESVDALLEGILEDEDYGPDAFNLVTWYEKEGRYFLEFEFPDPMFADQLQALLSQCRVEDLVIEAT